MPNISEVILFSPIWSDFEVLLFPSAKFGNNRQTTKYFYNFFIKLGEKVEKGETIATLYTNNEAKVEPAQNIIYEAYRIDKVKPEERPLILSKIK